MKTLASFLLLFGTVTQFLCGQAIQTLTFPASGPDRERSIPVLAGETLEILTFITPDYGVKLKIGEIEFQTAAGSFLPNFFQGMTFAGPLTVSISVPSGRALVFTYKMTPNTTVATQCAPAQAVVIPADTIAPVDIILESSTDLMTWTAALPGNYGTSPSKRFFRVRTMFH
jgi:hypothetical protein